MSTAPQQIRTLTEADFLSGNLELSHIQGSPCYVVVGGLDWHLGSSIEANGHLYRVDRVSRDVMGQRSVIYLVPYAGVDLGDIPFPAPLPSTYQPQIRTLTEADCVAGQRDLLNIQAGQPFSVVVRGFDWREGESVEVRGVMYRVERMSRNLRAGSSTILVAPYVNAETREAPSFLAPFPTNQDLSVGGVAPEPQSNVTPIGRPEGARLSARDELQATYQQMEGLISRSTLQELMTGTLQDRVVNGIELATFAAPTSPPPQTETIEQVAARQFSREQLERFAAGGPEASPASVAIPAEPVSPVQINYTQLRTNLIEFFRSSSSLLMNRRMMIGLREYLGDLDSPNGEEAFSAFGFAFGLRVNIPDGDVIDNNGNYLSSYGPSAMTHIAAAPSELPGWGPRFGPSPLLAAARSALGNLTVVPTLPPYSDDDVRVTNEFARRFTADDLEQAARFWGGGRPSSNAALREVFSHGLSAKVAARLLRLIDEISDSKQLNLQLVTHTPGQVLWVIYLGSERLGELHLSTSTTSLGQPSTRRQSSAEIPAEREIDI